MAEERKTLGKVLFTEQDIIGKAEELGAQITEDYQDGDLIVVGTLKGAVMWMSELIKHIDLDLKIDFVSASSYGSGTTSSGVVKITKDLSMDIYQKDVLIVEDIIDTGTTLNYLTKSFKERGPRSVKICTMLDKPSRRRVPLAPDYKGFTVEDLFIIGYGLDYDQKYRNLPYISYLEPGDIQE
ncbi:MAG: hypoxanthine phosphoribosyltransferase [Clostridiales bacterium]|jgi:hypoxanthine phosphoribosyltransferase|nr:hypoxanthine phosphoribosyltransferase [Clostridiales bacterium]